jgi:hypothetical protein
MAQGALYEWAHDENPNGILGQSQGGWDFTGAFEGNPIPTLILEGRYDLTWPEKKKDILKANHPNGRMAVFEAARREAERDAHADSVRALRHEGRYQAKADPCGQRRPDRGGHDPQVDAVMRIARTRRKWPSASRRPNSLDDSAASPSNDRCCARQSKNVCGFVVPPTTSLSSVPASSTATSRSCSSKGRPRRTTASTIEKMAVAEPMPSASTVSATAV